MEYFHFNFKKIARIFVYIMNHHVIYKKLN